MTAKVVFHLPQKFVMDFEQRRHLEFYAKAKDFLQTRGAELHVVARDIRLCDPTFRNWRDLLNDVDLHIIENGCVQVPNALNAAIAYIPPYWHLDGRGVLSNSAIGRRKFRQSTVNFQQAMTFFKAMRRQYVVKRRSRYNQNRAVESIPKGAIAVFLQGRLPQQQGTAYCTTEEMLRSVLSQANGHPVVVKAHPLFDQLEDIKVIHRLQAEGYEFLASDANIHDILKECALTVSFNSAVAMEGFLHRKPAVLFGKSDFCHFAETVRNPIEFPKAMVAALSRKAGYAQFIFWYFHQNCLSVQRPDFGQELLQKFAQTGFSPRKLGLSGT